MKGMQKVLTLPFCTSSSGARTAAEPLRWVNQLSLIADFGGPQYTDRKNVTNFLYLVLHLACKVTCYFRLHIQFGFSLIN